MREGAAARPLPERPAPPDDAAAAARRRHVRGDRLGHRDRRGRANGSATIRDAHGGESIFYYGGGGQGNHLGGAYGARDTQRARLDLHARTRSRRRRRASSGSTVSSSGGPRCHTTGDYEHAEVAVFVGKNPWQSHGFPRARTVLKAIVNDPERALIVIDPRRTETAELADYPSAGASGHRRVAASRALLASWSRRSCSTTASLADARATADELRAHLATVPIADSCATRRCEPRRTCGRSRAASPAPRASSIYEDLGIQQAPHSTLNSYLEKLALPAHRQLREAGRDEHPHAHGGPRRWRQGRRRRRSPVGGHRIITGLIPCNVDPRRDPHRPSRALPGDDRRERRTRSTRSPTASACARRFDALELRRGDRRRPDRDRAPRGLRPAGLVPVREVGGDVLHARVPGERLPAARADPRAAARHAAGARDPRRLVRALGAFTDDDVAGLHAAARNGARRVRGRLSRRHGRAAAPRAGSRRSCSTRRSARRSARAEKARLRCGASRRRAS